MTTRERATSDTVRIATVQDLDRLAPLFDAYRQFYGQAPDLPLARRFLEERLSREESRVLLAEDAGVQATGFVQLYPSFTSVRAARTFILNDLYVAAAARQRGVGSRLLEAAAELASASGAVQLSLSTEVTNLAAQRVYEAMGWRRESRYYEYVLALRQPSRERGGGRG